MFLNNYHHLKKKEIYTLILLIIFSIFIRIPTIAIFGDTSLDNEWGVLVNNLIVHGTLAINYQNDNLYEYLLPNVFMPPLYAYYLYLFSFFNLEEQNYIHLILSSQIILASIAVVIFYKINKLFFSICRKEKSYFNYSFFFYNRFANTFKRRVYCYFSIKCCLSNCFF